MEAHQTSPRVAVPVNRSTGFTYRPSPMIRKANWRDQFAICDIECACFGRKRLLFGLWARVGSRNTQTWLAQAGIEGADGSRLNGNVAGYLIAYPWPLDGQPLTYIGGVGVKPLYRQQGIGEQLTQQVLNSSEAVWLHVRDHNHSAIHLYDKLGFQVVRQLEHFYSNGDNALVMLRDSARR